MTVQTECLSPILSPERSSDRLPLRNAGRGLARILQPVRRLLNHRRFLALQRTWLEARLVLGKRMREAGIDDGSLGVQITEMEGTLRRPEAAPSSTQALEAARTALFLQLADLALEDDAPLPGADAEYRAAKEAQAALVEANHGRG